MSSLNGSYEKYMRRAIELAKKGEGFVSPNPMVGAVIVKEDRVIGEGYHARYGDLHAERNAIKNLTESAEGATIYVTLEPCCHHGKQPPCTEALVEAGIKKVVIGSRDPNPLVSGKGTAFLRAHGIEVQEDFLKEECDALNPVFFHYITTKMPYVVLKYAQTMDGKIATKTGASKWITGDKAREAVQHLRHKYRGIMAGIGTVLADDPMLNTRIEGYRSPVRIIVDSNARIPIESNIVKTAKTYETILAYAEMDKEKEQALLQAGLSFIKLPRKAGHIDLQALMEELGKRKIDSVLVEGGGTLNESLLRERLVNACEVFMAPKIFGGKDAKTPVEGEGVELPADCYTFNFAGMAQVGDDILLHYRKA